MGTLILIGLYGTGVLCMWLMSEVKEYTAFALFFVGIVICTAALYVGKKIEGP